MTLYRPDAFEPLIDEAWDEHRVRDAICEIVADADAAYRGVDLWPADEWDGWQAAVPMKNLYLGAAGVVWALDALRRRGAAEPRLDLAAAAAATLAAWRQAPDFMTGLELPTHPQSALLSGETGILVIAWRLAPSAELADDLLARVRDNLGCETNELMWGVPGTMLAAGAMLGWTGEERWRDAWRESADALWAARDGDGLWTQRLYGETFRSLGAPHGLVGNVRALLHGEDERLEEQIRLTLEWLVRTAVLEDGLANWPLAEGRGLEARDGEIRMQWCGGAPGIVVSTADYLDEELLLAGAELAWRAGAPGLEKGAGICHGTAGNGYAFLKVFARTGDERWLQRARRFAVHALAQVRRLRERRGRGRYSLWTGDVGVALYAADCLDARSTYPIVDTFDW